MTDQRRAPRLDPARVGRILAPFEAAGGLTVVVEDAAGRPIAGEPDAAPGGGSETSVCREIRAGDALAGRLIVSGPGAAFPSVAAALDALATSLGELARVDADELESELAHGRIQQRSIVSLRPPEVPGYDLAGHYEAAREIGGDFFELFRLRRRGRPLGIVIADVTGKGIAAALMMAFARPVIHAALDVAVEPVGALSRTNRILVDEVQSGLFITAIAGTLDPRSGHVRLANAGHEPALLVPGDGGPVIAIPGGGPLLGAFRTPELHEETVDLGPGDTLVLYTDGVTDASAPSGERFGEDRLLATIEAARAGSAHDLVAAIRDAVAGFRRDVEPVDDVTIVAVGRRRP
jgi:phosphoserine phosphatase RsbU/P